jgi:DNA-binding SARP family transcriptional activator
VFADAVVFLVLGAVETCPAGRVDRSWTAKPQALLSLLLLKPNTVVDRDWLVDQLWGDAPPASAVSTLRTYAYQIRQRLAADERITLRGKGGGYLLAIPPDAVDAARFEALVAAGRAAIGAGDHAGGAAALREGLRMWRGPAFDGVDVPAVRVRAQALDDLRLEAFEQCVRAELEAGLGIGEVTELEAEIADQPLRESLWHTLMLALYRAGRQGEALEAYRRLHRVLDEELGIRPSAQVEELHRQILAGRPPAPGAADLHDEWTVPRQLPAATAHFTGRTGELAELDALLAEDGPTVAAVSGAGGIGKSTLAFAWAHRAADRFPDGQLYCDLHGFDPAAAPADPGEAVRDLLESLGTAPESIPAGLDAQTALYHSRLADKRVLVVLDNARDAAQVRPLLPGSASCRVLVTSRDRLSGLVADGARPLPLAELSTDDARAYLTDRLRVERTGAEPEAVQRIIDACAGLPLALAVAAARAALNPRFPLAELAAALHEDAHRLDALADPDPAVDLRTVLHGSYRALDDRTARLFRLLSAHPGPAFSPAAAAAAAALPLPQTERLLTALTRLNLLAEPVPRRYAFHDLVRIYATELAADERPEAARRVLDHYLQTAYAAARLVNPLRDPIAVEPPVPGVPVADLPDADAAMAWFTAEHPVLLAAVERAAAERLDAHCWQLAWCLHDYLHRRGRRHDQAAVWRTALDAARRLGDRAAQTRALRQLAQARVHLKEFDAARTHLDEALALADDVGNDRAHTHQVYGALASVQGRHAESIEHNRRAIDHYRATGHRAGEASALNSIAWVQSQAGDHKAALESGTAALSIMEIIGHRAGQAATLDSLGLAHHRLGELHRAVDRYEAAVALYRGLGARAGEAATLARLGDVHRARGESGAARDAFKRAADLLDELGHADASKIRAMLRDAD